MAGQGIAAVHDGIMSQHAKGVGQRRDRHDDTLPKRRWIAYSAPALGTRRSATVPLPVAPGCTTCRINEGKERSVSIRRIASPRIDACRS